MFDFLFNKKILCPYCFNYFKIEDVEYRCVNSKCSKERDSKLEKVWDDSRVKNIAFKPKLASESESGDFDEENNVICLKCKNPTDKRLCPECHIDLPPQIEEIKNRIFAVVGSADAGKSHYLSVLIKKIEEIEKNMNFSLRTISDDTRNRYENDFYKPIFEKKEELKKTNVASGNISVRKPLLFRLDFIKDSFFEKNKKDGSCMLAFFDTAGEDLNNEDNMTEFNKYIYYAKGIIFLIDPLKILEVQKKIKPSSRDKSVNIKDILTRVISVIEKGKKLRINKKIDIPIAITFTKIDVLDSIIDSSYQIKQSKNKIIYDESDSNAISSEMKSLLLSWGEDSFVRLIETQFKTYRFFGVSALGHQPINSRLSTIKPRRVEDPFLWLLKESKLLKVKK